MRYISLLLLALVACSGTQIGVTGGGAVAPGGDVTWQVGVQIAIRGAEAALPPAKAEIDSDPQIPAATKASVDVGLDVAAHALPQAQTALETYQRAPTVTSQCQVHFYVEQAITEMLETFSTLIAARLKLDVALVAAVGSLGVVADILWPGCVSSSAPPSPQSHEPAMLRIQRVLERARHQ